jgi:hypothetical protein
VYHPAYQGFQYPTVIFVYTFIPQLFNIYFTSKNYYFVLDLPDLNQRCNSLIKDIILAKDWLQNYLIFCFQNTQSFKGFWKQFRSSYFVTIHNHGNSIHRINL